ncbi:unnamed protein product [Larinioides sclopetarius]|uniref:KilA-N domain-containing protein n=1 Tax=Larinioides sclopetarius TaxID=280406 RepID=A0AAV1ZJS5_9ARAC
METLSDVFFCYEQIQDQYWYALYGDFKFVVDRNTNWFNATKLCRDCGRRFGDWLKIEEGKSLIMYYHKKGVISNLEKPFIEVETKTEDVGEIISGTYVPHQFILAVTMWLSPKFGNEVYKILNSRFECEKKQT